MEQKIDKDKFRELFKEYYNPLTNLAYRILKNENLAEDMVQEVFASLWEKKSELKIKNLTPYLFKSVYHKCIEHLRKEKIKSKYLEQVKLDFPAYSKKFEDLGEKYLLKEKIYNSLRQLPPKCRSVFVESKINGLTYSEIADKYNISKKTVENQMSIAFKKLRMLLANMNK